MFEQRSPKVDLLALALGALGVFLVIALVSYDRTDPPSNLVWPPTGVVHNACGVAGAHAAHALLHTLGVGAHYAVGSLLVVVTLMLTGRPINQPIVRAIGWALSLVAVATLATMAAPGWSPGPIVGAGGVVGAMGRAWLETNFAAAGAYLFTFCVLLAGLLLSTDYFVFSAAATATAVSGKTLVTAGRLGATATKRLVGKKRLTDLDTPPSGKNSPKAKPEEELADDEEWEEEDAEEEAEDGEEWEYEEEDAEGEEEDEEPELQVKTPAKQAAEEPATEEAPAAEPTAAGLGKRLVSALRGKGAAEADAAEGEANDPAETALTPIKKPKPKSERDEIIDKLDAADQQAEFDSDYELPPVDLLLPGEEASYDAQEKEIRRKAKVLEKTFLDFGFNVKVVEVETGPVIAQYEVELEAGLRLSKITGLADDLAIALRAPSVRIVAPIPGKNTVGIEVPNENRQLVRLREVIEETDGRAKRMKIPIYLGKDVSGNPMVVDLAALPHLLIAGRTGTGKSVCLNSIILSILMSRGPDEVRMLMIDPKMVELSGYRKLPHLMHPVVTDMKKAEAILSWAVDKMEERYQLLARAGVRHVSVYNQLSEAELRDRLEPEDGAEWTDAEWSLVPKQLPFIVIVADEMADLMMTAGKDVEAHIIRLAQKSRAVGIHLILATQKPTVDVITGLIKSNLPARIAFQVASRTDSRVVLDEMGADKLLGNGDMLFLSPGTSMLLRGQGTYLSDDEITKVVDFVGTDDQQFAAELMQLKTKEEQEQVEAGDKPGLKNRDDLYEAAVDVVVREGRGSVSLLQRCLGIGYGRAARLIDFMAEDGIVGEYNGSQAREILISVEEWEQMSGAADGEPSAGPAEASPTVPIVPAAAPAVSLAKLAAEEAAVEEDEEEEEQDDADAEQELADDEEWEYEEEDEAEEDEEEAKAGDAEADEELGEDEEWEYEEEGEAEEEDAEEDEAEEDGELADDEEWEYEEEDAEDEVIEHRAESA
ncbi:DNA translocase FtsK [Pseudobythopirellula maris]|uniref:DNA translocase FtsK n=1 Tax=Pseudobythopirellula maris TaxID=2527991 RepID=A0A5C5ZM67_9BACT|nr:DNA translocase FtsK [Pseudobythopirellula maris]TWT88308.1 DNA translocase FtsK [Pseudobythopirellula maris]